MLQQAALLTLMAEQQAVAAASTHPAAEPSRAASSSDAIPHAPMPRRSASPPPPVQQEPVQTESGSFKVPDNIKFFRQRETRAKSNGGRSQQPDEEKEPETAETHLCNKTRR